MFAKPLLFLSSYAPLFGLLAIRVTDWNVRFAFIALAAVGLIGLWVVLKVNSSATATAHTLVSVQDAGPEAASYLASYLLPFVTISEPSTRDLIIYAGFFLIAATIHIRSSIIQINPTLYMLGMRILAVQDNAGFQGYLLARGELERDSRVWCVPLNKTILVQHLR